MKTVNKFYRQIISDYQFNQYWGREINKADYKVSAESPSCGDKIAILATTDETDEVITDISLIGGGCAVMTASASILAELCCNKKVSEVEKLCNDYRELLVKGEVTDEEELGKLAMFKEISHSPSRVKCALLPAHTMKLLVENVKNMVR